jgi:phosphopantothenoylcysteine decarboxylase
MNVLLGITGSVAATLGQRMENEIQKLGHTCKSVVTPAALNFDNLPYARYDDEDEWRVYKLQETVLHIDLTKWAEAFIVAPCTANTLSKIHYGLCDNLLTCCVRAWPGRLVIAPSMNCQMWANPVTARIIRKLGKQHIIVPPQEKKLFCGDTGMGAMAEIKDIINYL